MRVTPIVLITACALAAPVRGQVPEPPAAPSADERERAAAASPPAEQRTEPATPAAGEQVTERIEGDQIITEYRRRGQLYMVKVKPRNGPPQYWLDRDGDGQFQRRDTDINEDVNLPKWRIGNW